MKLIFKIVIFLALSALGISNLKAQAPVILSVHKHINAAGGKVTLIGSNFGTDATKLVVHFGGAKAPIVSVTNQILETTVPAGATFENISVTNITTGLTGFTNDQFLLSYGGEHPLTASNLQGQFDFDASLGLYDLCMCDLDGDGKNDIASVNDNATSISLFRNTSSIGTLSFVKSVLSIGARTLHVRCGDLNGDGKQDVIMSEGGNGDRIFILKNNSTSGSLSFSLQNISLTGKRPKRIEVADLDLDGKPELIITDQGNGNVLVLSNTSSLAAISFATPQVIVVPGAASTDGLAVEDINDDRMPDIIVNQFLSANSNIFILKNESTPGNIKLDNQITLSVPGTLVNLSVGDLDGDDKPDIAATQLLSSSISVFLNQGTGSLIQFSSINNILTDDRPWGIDFSDMDGDGKSDIVVASITNKSLTLLNNESTPGNLSFTKLVLPTTFINRHIRMGDLDGDSKPEIAFTSIDDNNLGIPASKISIFRNKNCFVPTIDPPGPITICSSFPLHVTSTQSAGVTLFEWTKDGTGPPVASGLNSFFDVTATGQYTVTAISEGGSCSKTSNAVDVTVVVAGTVGAPDFSGSNSPVCINDNLIVPISSTNATGFDWTGPNGFTFSGNPMTRSNFKPEFAGRYMVDIRIGSCIASQSSVLVESVVLPDFKVSYTGSEVVCSGDSKALSTTPSIPGFTYQWFEKTSGLISGQTTPSYSTAASGEFYYEAKSTAFPSCPAVESNTVKISVVSTPVVAFSAPAESCRNGIVQFTNQAVTDPSAVASYLWDFGDGQTSISASPTHSFSSIQTFNVKLSVSYAGGSCPEELTKSIKISAAPAASITTASNTFSFCSGETLKLEVNGTFNTYLWSTTENSSSITIDKAGTYIVDVTTSAGCKLSLSQVVSLLPAPQVLVEASPDNITSGESVQLNTSGLASYDWDPGKLVSDSTIANPTSLPLQTTVFKVSGKGSNGCPGEGSIEVKVKGESAVSKLKPSSFFSPNGDAMNNVWSVDNILNFPQCAITIYDDKGIKLYEAKPYMNDWDGSFQGKLLPNGVYFYIIRCDGEEGKPKTGSITLIR